MEDERMEPVKNWPEPKSIYDIQVFLGFANFYGHFIYGFNKISRSLTSKLRTTNFIGLSIISQLLIDAGNKDEVGKSGGNKTNLSNPSISKRSTGADYLIFKGIKKGGNNLKRGGGNTKNCIKAAKGFNYLILDPKKAFNHLQHAFTQWLIF